MNKEQHEQALRELGIKQPKSGDDRPTMNYEKYKEQVKQYQEQEDKSKASGLSDERSES